MKVKAYFGSCQSPFGVILDEKEDDLSSVNYLNFSRSFAVNVRPSIALLIASDSQFLSHLI